MTATCSRVTNRPSVKALRMIGNKYRLRTGLALFPVNHSAPVMKITIDQDSINNRVRVRPGKNRRARNITMATTNALSRQSTGHNWVISARDHTSTNAARAKHNISMDRVLRTG